MTYIERKKAIRELGRNLENNCGSIIRNWKQIQDLLGEEFAIVCKFHSKAREFTPISAFGKISFYRDLRDCYLPENVYWWIHYADLKMLKAYRYGIWQMSELDKKLFMS